MTIDIKDLLNSIMDSLSRLEDIRPDEFPNIPLYMDQVTTFMEDELKATKRYQDDKILTKTMINNYAKNNLLPPPDKKKYSKEHMLTLVFIYYFKSVLSINDIQSILNPLTDKYFGKKDSFNLEDIYKNVFDLEVNQVESIKKSIEAEYNISENLIEKIGDRLDKEDEEFMRNFMFICLLNFDVYVKKLLMEKIIDAMNEDDTTKNKRKK